MHATATLDPATADPATHLPLLREVDAAGRWLWASGGPGDGRPVLVIDSGLGGLTVVRALRRRLPDEPIVYFGDTARLPYGGKSVGTVAGYVRQIVAHCRGRFDPKHVVIACNTASAVALDRLRRESPDVPITGVVDPGARAAVRAAGARHRPTIGVIATEATVRSGAYEHAIHRRRQHATLLLRPTPLLAPMIEEGRRSDDPLVKLALEQYLAPLLVKRLHVLLLGCTHYPLLARAVSEAVGPRTAVIDSAGCCADDVARRLIATGRLAPALTPRGDLLRCLVTDDSPRFARLASRFLGHEIDAPEVVAVEDLYAAVSPPALRATA